jgi:hypothetical protein
VDDKPKEQRRREHNQAEKTEEISNTINHMIATSVIDAVRRPTASRSPPGKLSHSRVNRADESLNVSDESIMLLTGPASAFGSSEV